MNAVSFKKPCLLLAVAIWMLLPNMVQAQPKTIRQQIQDTLNRADASFEHKDINGCLAVLTEDFQGADIDGARFDKAATKRGLMKEFSPTHFVTASHNVKSQVISITPKGAQAVVMYREHLVTVIATETIHEQHVLTLDTLRRSTWMKTKNGWREQQEVQLTSRITQDGILKSVQDKR